MCLTVNFSCFIFCRQGAIALIQGILSVWQLLVHEHGAIISTLLALATFCGLFFFLFLLHKTLSPRRQPSTVPVKVHRKQVSSKKKKRKGGSSSNSHRHRTAAKSSSETLPESSVEEDEEYTALKAAPSNDYCESVSTATLEPSTVDDLSATRHTSLPVVLEDTPITSPLKTLSVDKDSLAAADEEPLRLRVHSESSSDTQPRFRALSESSVDTAASDDHSTDAEWANVSKSSHQRASSSRKSSSAARRRTGTRKQLTTTGTDPRQSKGSTFPAPPSRWDVLKPTIRLPVEGSKCRGPQSRPQRPSRHHRGRPAATTTMLKQHPIPVEPTGLPPSSLTSSSSSLILRHPKIGQQLPTRNETNQEPWVTAPTKSLSPEAPPFPAPPVCSSYESDSWASSAVPPASCVSSTSFALPPTSPLPLFMPATLSENEFAASAATTAYFSAPRVKKNPFDPEDDSEVLIEAELQELGGQMVGSVLDF